MLENITENKCVWGQIKSGGLVITVKGLEKQNTGEAFYYSRYICLEFFRLKMVKDTLGSQQNKNKIHHLKVHNERSAGKYGVFDLLMRTGIRQDSSFKKFSTMGKDTLSKL